MSDGIDERPTRSLSRADLLAVVARVTLLVLGTLLLVALADVWLLSFGGVLFAVALHGAGNALAERSPLSVRVAVAIVCTVTFIAAALVLWSMGPAFADGLAGLRSDLPAAIERLRDVISSSPGGAELLELASKEIEKLEPGAGMLGRIGDVFSGALGALSAVGGALVGLLVIAVIAIYGALSPTTYTDAFVALLPRRHHGRAHEVLGELAISLRWWLVGRACSMLVVGVLTWLGLMLLGVPSAGTMGALAALLSFVPNIGPIVSAIPAILLGFGQGPTIALYVIGLYVAIQTVESYVITPLIQQRVVALPPAAVIVTQLAFGTALGLLGLLFATPIAVVVRGLVRMLWIQDTLDRQVASSNGPHAS